MKLPALLLLLASSSAVLANVEKVIFVTADRHQRQPPPAALQHLRLEALSVSSPTLRTRLPIAFADSENPKGLQSWYLLRGLAPSTRFEVRICWAAIQPTQFWLYTYRANELALSETLIRDARRYSESLSRQKNSASLLQVLPAYHTIDSPGEVGDSLFLQVFAAADYFTLNETLMKDPQPVLVDIILDQYYLNVIPVSLLPTAAYLTVLAVGGWLLSGIISTWLFSDWPLPSKPSHTD